MEIKNSTIGDIDEIFRLYRVATAFQLSKGMVSWPEFERSLVETEINEHRQWKLLIDGSIACVWAVTFRDPQIWEERDNDASMYIHRIATNPDFKGRNLVAAIVDWAKGYAAANGIKFIRLDTVGKNEKLIAHYVGCGFDYLGLFQLKHTEGLPQHYDNAAVSLFEIRL